MKVVIADDAVTFRERGNVLLADLPKVQVIGEFDRLEALRVILAQRPDVAILDIQMPGASGVQILREVNVGPVSSPAPHIPLFVENPTTVTHEFPTAKSVFCR